MFLFFLASERFKCDWFSTRCFSHLSGSSSLRWGLPKPSPHPSYPSAAASNRTSPLPFSCHALELKLAFCGCFCGIATVCKKKRKKEKHARGYFAALIGDLTVAGLQLYEQCGIFLRCHSRLLRMLLSPKRNSELSKVQLTYLLRRMERREAKRNTPKNIARTLMTFEAPEGMWKYFGGTYFRQIRAKFGLKMHTCDQKKNICGNCSTPTSFLSFGTNKLRIKQKKRWRRRNREFLKILLKSWDDCHLMKICQGTVLQSAPNWDQRVHPQIRFILEKENCIKLWMLFGCNCTSSCGVQHAGLSTLLSYTDIEGKWQRWRTPAWWPPINSARLTAPDAYPACHIQSAAGLNSGPQTSFSLIRLYFGSVWSRQRSAALWTGAEPLKWLVALCPGLQQNNDSQLVRIN